jgi:hypothetical protein
MATPSSPDGQNGKLPQWLLLAVSVISITTILCVGAHKFMVEHFGFGFLEPAPFLLLLLLYALSTAPVVLAVVFVVYVFNWMRQTRNLLRQIEANARWPKLDTRLPQQKQEPAKTDPLKPLYPPEDAKYMPKR